jgi:hypothetical protein
MHLDRNPDRHSRICKIKRVNPAFRSVSTPRGTKDLPVVGPVNPTTSLGSLDGPNPASEWSAERLCERLRIELAPAAWTRLILAAKRHGVTLEHLLRSALSEVA